MPWFHLQSDSIPRAEVEPACQRLLDEARIVAGESGGVGLAGLVAAMRDPAGRAALGLDGGARIFVINTEGATDPGRYRELVGLAPEAVGAGDEIRS